MSRLVFWDAGQAAAAEVAVACAVTLGLHYPQRVLLVNEGRIGCGVEEGLRPSGLSSAEAAAAELAEHGIDALLRLLRSRRLSPGNFADYTLPVLQGRLDLVSGTRNGSAARAGAEAEEINELLRTAELAYDLVLSCVEGRRRLSEALRTLQGGDVIVAVVPQRLGLLDDFFAEVAPISAKLEHRICLAIQPFDPSSRWNLTNLKRRYRSRLPMFGIPYHSEFADAWNDRESLAFLRKYKLLSKRGGSRGELLEVYREMSGKVLELSGKADAPGSVNGKGA
ncbi:hypothetical protein [Paenibacillus macerans]|uniref:hypothetical protein n=1 Tax=Paenibacillus macerans TaxID=44252 RepID=UPI003D31ED9E